MPVYHVKCYETVNFTVSIEAESEEEVFADTQLSLEGVLV